MESPGKTTHGESFLAQLGPVVAEIELWVQSWSGWGGGGPKGPQSWWLRDSGPQNSDSPCKTDGIAEKKALGGVGGLVGQIGPCFCTGGCNVKQKARTRDFQISKR